MEEWQASTVQRWESERASRPTDVELENWERTVADIRNRYRLTEGHKDRAELCHRLAVAYVKMEDYAQAMTWVDLGLAEGSEDWVRELQEDMALIFYLQDRKEEAMAILDELAQKPPLVPKANPPKRITPRVTEEVFLNLICPHCDADVPYGQLRCSSCGAKVDDKFALVRTTKDGRSVKPVEEVETHRIKEFSILLTDFTVDYDDPMNFLTAHRVRFMGGEMVTVTERAWYVWTGFIVLVFFYLLYGILIMSMFSAEAPPGVILALGILMMAIVLPTTIMYLYVVFPNFMGNAFDQPILDD
ncbi:MAG: tetratricopeptide repeat protein [Methanomassiliicoccales archaeon]